MTTLPLDEIRTGMVLNRNVLDVRGRLLLGEGAAITNQHLRIFRAWGVAEVEIDGAPREEPPPLSETVDPDLYREALDAAKALFRKSEANHPLVQILVEKNLRIRLNGAQGEG